MNTDHFTSLVEEKLKLADYPEIIQEVIVNDLAELILKRVYTDIVMSMKDDDAERALTLLESGDFENLYAILTSDERFTAIADNAAQEILEEFTKQMYIQA